MLKNNFIFFILTLINFTKFTISQLNIKLPNALLEIFNSKEINKIKNNKNFFRQTNKYELCLLRQISLWI